MRCVVEEKCDGRGRTTEDQAYVSVVIVIWGGCDRRWLRRQEALGLVSHLGSHAAPMLQASWHEYQMRAAHELEKAGHLKCRDVARFGWRSIQCLPIWAYILEMQSVSAPKTTTSAATARRIRYQ
jgi:hypothetical protein